MSGSSADNSLPWSRLSSLGNQDMEARRKPLRMLVTGREGQVVSALVELGWHQEEFEILALGRPDLDLADTRSIDGAITARQPDIIVSAAAYTAVDQAETDTASAHAVNGVAPGEIGRVASRLGIPVIHLSTDYVFDGTKTSPYEETDPTNPVGVYGRSKLEGEHALAAATDDHVILRTAWVYSPFGRNFVKTMLTVAATRDRLSVVDDQQGNPTSALDIADAIVTVARNLLQDRASTLRGTFHLAGRGAASWADFAAGIFETSRLMGGPSAELARITSADYPTAARRPANSRLHTAKLASVHGVTLPDWQSSMRTVVSRCLPLRDNNHQNPSKL
ncbi:dTDP-4-dehydrorhamnose reductase [Rhizobium sp. AG855]|nr:dTDP-4-dehydrorhamnose reductase [Rhizobium sp. AG855]